jgi:hypothetical protein
MFHINLSWMIVDTNDNECPGIWKAAHLLGNWDEPRSQVPTFRLLRRGINLQINEITVKLRGPEENHSLPWLARI